MTGSPIRPGAPPEPRSGGGSQSRLWAAKPPNGAVPYIFTLFPVLLAFVSLIDPRLRYLGLVSVGLGLLPLLMARLRGRSLMPPTVALLLSISFVLTSWSEPRWCCDAAAYYMYLRSALFDHDLSLLNEWVAFGVPNPPLTAIGRAMNAASIGPALLWFPFVLVAHLYVIADGALGSGPYPANGYSVPYLLATAAGTNAAVVLGIVALWKACAERFSPRVASVALVFGLLGSTLPYYAFVVPSVAHGPVFAASALFLTQWLKVEREPSLGGWLKLSAVLGLVSLLRWQAVVLGLMFVPLFVDGWRRRISRWWWPVATVLVSVLVFSPQALVWSSLFGSPFAAPVQFHGMDWTSPHFVNVLFSADRGLFTWTPVMALGCLGWILMARRQPSFALAAWAVFFATTWVNGGVAMWSGADAFGARRFDLLIPLWAFGLAAGIQASAGLVQRRPLIAPAFALGVFTLWTLSLMRFHRNGVFTEAAPFEEVVARQAAVFRHASEDGMGWIAGDRGRNFAYRMLVGRYFYWNTGFDGLIDLSRSTVPGLSGTWSERMDLEDLGAFRFAEKSGACVRVPFESPFDLRVVVSARSLVSGQAMGLSANGSLAGERELPMEWSEAHYLVPAALLRPGENLLCLSFSTARRNGRAAAVRRFQLP